MNHDENSFFDHPYGWQVDDDVYWVNVTILFLVRKKPSKRGL
ncbi:hypothetical protein I600_1746 [Maribacter dokdonensis DSW-8]|nr:hypothetical protein I600_1746 [Maribacter dokdonensis DSW-8]